VISVLVTIAKQHGSAMAGALLVLKGIAEQEIIGGN